MGQGWGGGGEGWRGDRDRGERDWGGIGMELWGGEQGWMGGKGVEGEKGENSALGGFLFKLKPQKRFLIGLWYRSTRRCRKFLKLSFGNFTKCFH